LANIFFISDTHFNHANILKFTHGDTGQLIRPGFDDVNHMNETMIERWNGCIKPQDKVYHLGDVYFGNQQTANGILHRLNGHKRLLLGNHDKGKDTVLHQNFDKIELWRMFKEDGLLFTHVPVHPSTLGEDRFTPMGKPTRKMVNVHGHIHQNKSPEGPYFCVCVEHIDYTPIELGELKDRTRSSL
jgi:calcineurin-like phosphoesterase family protein